MNTSDFHYDLPPELIAQHPAARRDESRMMVVHRATRSWEHRLVGDLPDFLLPGDLLVLNNTRVIPARIFGRKHGTGGRVELLLLEETAPGVWDVLLRASRRPKPGSRFSLGTTASAEAEMLADGDLGRATVRIHASRHLLEILEQEGLPPLPPYIRRELPEPGDRARYQTIYAKHPGAAAAPTAGLHFTENLFERLAERGVQRAEITLHVGLGTFRPVSVPRLEDHLMHEERYEITEAAAASIREARLHGRIVAVGSTSVRTLETVAAQHNGDIPACAGRSSLFIHPPYSFRATDLMLTNFHLPESTLLMMVSALAGHDLIMRAYRDAVENKYRFFSYGDCMLIAP